MEKDLQQKLAEAVKELRDVVESKTADSAENKTKIEKIQTAIDKFEESNQKQTAEFLAAKKEAEELKNKITNLEKELYRLPNGKGFSEADESRKIEIKKALNTFYRKDPNHKTRDEVDLEVKYLRTDQDPAGGYLTPPEYFEEIIKKITEISPIRQYARVIQCSRESILIPTRETLLSGNWVGEGKAFTVSNSTYGQREIKVNLLSVSVPVTIQMLQDSVFNVENIVSEDISESFAFTEGNAFVVGDGVEKPEGILAKAGLTNGPAIYNSGISNSFDGDSLINIAGQLKVGYNPAYMANRKTLAFIRTLKDGLGQYLWTPGLANEYPSMINGYPYISAIDVPDIGASANAVIFGDFGRGYVIVDHINLMLIRDAYSQIANGKIVFNALRRVGGQVVLPEAIKVLQCHT